jgi:NADPH-dependent 2,4-dienoyl-CoA reductase/sulfur reductase-like enzyme
MGIAYRAHRMIDAPAVSRKVAVIGGGPAGMRAAVVAAERGHKVTLYERNDFLGGQLRHADFASFQWPVKDYKDYLSRQMEKLGVEVLLKTRATPEMIRAKGYDVVMAATGADPVIPDIPGARENNALAPIFVYGNNSLGENVVVIGGDVIGTQTGIYLGQNGHNVTVLTSEKKLGHDSQPVHYFSTVQLMYEAMDNFSYITEVSVTGISKGKVTYVDAEGKEKSIRADNVVISAERQPRKEEAQKFYGTASRFFAIGDCDSAGSVRTCTRTAFAAASQI